MAVEILKNIKLSTKESHDNIEKNQLMASLAQGTITTENYCYLLAKLYGFHKSNEEKLLDTKLWQEYNFDIQARLKTAWLEEDLTFLGFADYLEQDPLCQSMLTLNKDTQRLGFLYVVEGSTLGGQILSRQLKESFGYESKKGASYFNSYGKKNLGSMWLDFQKLLTRYSEENPKEDDEIIKSAIDTFARLDKCLRLQGAFLE